MEKNIKHYPANERPFPGFDPKNPIPGVEKPTWHERKVPSEDLISVALHEMGHALMAYHEGVSVDFVSVEPNAAEGYKGITKLSYVPADAYKLQKIAAAGSIFSTEGNGSDVHAIDSLSRHSKRGRTEAFASAHAFKGFLSDAEWEIVAEIVAERKRINGSEIPQILIQAKMEAAERERRGLTHQDLFNVNALNAWAESRIETSEKKIAEVEDNVINTAEIVDESRPNGIVITYIVKNGDFDKDSLTIRCTACGGEKAHTDICSNTSVNLEHELKKFRYLPRQATIFPK